MVDKGDDKDSGVQSQIRNIADDVADYVGKNRSDSVAYIILLIGFFVSFANIIIGGLIVGAVTGLYFGGELLAFVQGLHELIDRYGPVKSLIGLTAVVFLAIYAFWFLLGLAATVAGKALLAARSK